MHLRSRLALLAPLSFILPAACGGGDADQADAGAGPDGGGALDAGGDARAPTGDAWADRAPVDATSAIEFSGPRWFTGSSWSPPRAGRGGLVLDVTPHLGPRL